MRRVPGDRPTGPSPRTHRVRVAAAGVAVLAAAGTCALLLPSQAGPGAVPPTASAPAAPALQTVQVDDHAETGLTDVPLVTAVGPVALPPVATSSAPTTDHPVPVAPVPGPADVVTPAGTEVVGVLTRGYAENGHTEAEHAEDGHGEGEVALALTWVERADGSAVQVSTTQMLSVPSGAQVRVVVGAASAGSGELPVLAADVLSMPAGSADDAADTVDGDVDGTGDDEVAAAEVVAAVHQVWVVQVAPSGVARGTTPLSSVVNAVNGPVNDFWRTQTDGAVSFVVQGSKSWIDATASCSNPTGIWSQAAAAINFTPGENKHLLVYVPPGASGCYAGLATVGSPNAGGRSYVWGTETSLVAHELGHNLGLRHTDSLVCDDKNDGTAVTRTTFDSSCAVRSYGDWYDVMGVSWSSLGSLNAQHASYLGALGPADVVEVSESRQVTLRPLGGRTGVRAVRIVDGGATYWVEFRGATGLDAYLADSNRNYRGLQTGVVVRREYDAPTDERDLSEPGSVLLDASPGAGTGRVNDFQTALLPGQRLVLASGTIGIETVSQTSSTAVVSVVYSRAVPRVITPGAGTTTSTTPKTADPRANRVTLTADQYSTTEVKSSATSGAVLRTSMAAGEQAPDPQTAAAALTADLPAGTYVVSTWVSDVPGGDPVPGSVPVEVVVVR